MGSVENPLMKSRFLWQLGFTGLTAVSFDVLPTELSYTRILDRFCNKMLLSLPSKKS